jgi:hypothetical protein
MAFNFGIGLNGVSPSAALHSYYYNDLVYRRYVTQIALDFYTGRQDSYVWFDLKKQFRNPDKQQIVPYNITKEIIDETSILYREEPEYRVKDKNGKVLEKDTKLWKKIRKDGRYQMLCQQLDAMTKLLGTVLVQIKFVDPDTGDLVNENKPGIIQFDIVYGGFYTVNWTASPYYINELTFNFSTETRNKYNDYMFGGVTPKSSGLSVATIPTDTTQVGPRQRRVEKQQELGKINNIFWDARKHKVQDEDGNYYEGQNPYGCIPAIPFFNQDPGHRFFLPINEPLIYANHALNMRLSDLNHVTKYQSFGQAVVKGIERPLNNRLGRPIDDYGHRSGTRTFGFGQGQDVGPTGLDRNHFNGFGYYNDGNADANMNGYSVGPDTIISVGETGDFKFEHPKANIQGLVSAIYTMMDMTRMNYGLSAKHTQKNPSSGTAIQFEKLGVVEQNRRRALFFKEREQQLFKIVAKLWNVHHDKSPEDTFSEDCELDIYYVEPEFAVDPTTKLNALKVEAEIIETGNRHIISKMYPHLDDKGIDELIERAHSHNLEKTKREVEIENFKFENSKEAQHGVELQKEKQEKVEQPTYREPAKPGTARHSQQSSIQPNKNGDPRTSDKTERKNTQQAYADKLKQQKKS